jgi:hypothetical protein
MQWCGGNNDNHLMADTLCMIVVLCKLKPLRVRPGQETTLPSLGCVHGALTQVTEKHMDSCEPLGPST